MDVLYPPNHMMPWSAMFKFNTWSKEQGETKQEALIGMSSGRKDAITRAFVYREQLQDMV